MDQASGTVVSLLGFPMDVRCMSLRHWEWLVKQVERVETVVAGDAAKGKALFFGSGKCVQCHMIQGQGGDPGPDLSNIASERTVPQLRESVTKPGARIAEGFRGVTAVLASGATVKGVAKNYNNYSVQILDGSGKMHLLETREVKRLEWADGSLMPAVTGAEDAQNLIAFLARLSTRGGSK